MGGMDHANGKTGRAAPIGLVGPRLAPWWRRWLPRAAIGSASALKDPVSTAGMV
ncbi:hypothetical protein E4U54_005780 [Claviceps lovelessii]|nr:hypothetical protein E4U54_005780 [Claviceps lovelessii]